MRLASGYDRNASTVRALNVDASGQLLVSLVNADFDIRNLSEATDSILAYGNDGASNRQIKTDANGELQVDVLSLPNVVVDSGSVTASQATRSSLNCNATIQVAGSDLAFGQALMGASLPVVIASNQSTFEVTAIQGTATSLKALNYGSDDGGTTPRAIATDADGHVQVSVDNYQYSMQAYRNLDLALTSGQVSPGFGYIHKVIVTNQHSTSKRYLKCYRSAVATHMDTPLMTFVLLAGSTQSFDVNFNVAEQGFCMRATTGIADNDVGAPSTNDVVVTVLYD